MRVWVFFACLIWTIVPGLASEKASPEELRFESITDSAPWPVRHGHTVVVFKDRIWVMGGGKSERPSVIHGDVWSSPDGAQWRQELSKAPWGPRYLHQSLVFGGRIWIFGGLTSYRPHQNRNDVWWSEDGRHWSQATPDAGWPRRHVFTSLIHQGRMWMMAGAPDGTRYYNDVWTSTDGAGWQPVPFNGPRFSVRKNPASASFQGRMWVVGGGELVVPGVMVLRDDIWTSTSGRSWQLETSNSPWPARDFPTLVVYRDRLWLLGGRNPTGPGHLTDVWVTRDGVAWEKVASESPWPERHGGTLVVFHDKIWLLGGCTTGAADDHFNDIWTMQLE